ncbi:MAG: methylornithine synthase PylB [Desulfobacula sp.]|nr:methylornithine synthase PylB [Desulfobacula sp.]
MTGARFNLIDILDHLGQKHSATKDEIKFILGLSDPDEIQQLFKAARQVRGQHFGNQIFLYGFLYFSTHCQNNCNFCRYRRSNTRLVRYRKTKSQIIEAARDMADTGVHLIDLTMGEDPQLYLPGSFGRNAFQGLVNMVKAVQDETGCPVMISPGILPDEVLKDLADAGTTFYACYQETHNRDLYHNLRHGQGFEKRLEKKQLAKSLGMLIEEGIMTGVGESLDDLADSIIWMRDLSADQARVMTFVPQANTPMGNAASQDSLKERIIIAVMRLILKDCLIPASLDVDGLSGLKERLDAGANVVTSIVPPQKGLAGVANHSLDIEDAKRTLDHIIPILNSCGLFPASSEAYQSWINERQHLLKRSPVKRFEAKKEAMQC